MRDILFDEKIAGHFILRPEQSLRKGRQRTTAARSIGISCHFSVPNTAAVKIYFDDQLVRKDGLFVRKELTGLNPEYLGS